MKGRISFEVLKRTIDASGGFSIALAVVILYASASVLILIASWNIRTWARSFFTKNTQNRKFINQLLLISISIVLILWAVTYLIFISVTWVSRLTHSQMVYSLLHGQLDFLDRVKNGVFINRFSNDINEIDNSFPEKTRSLFYKFFKTVFSVVAVMIAFEKVAVLVPVILYLLIGFIIKNGYMKSSREMRRLSAVSKSPIAGRLLANLNGSAVIRGSKKTAFSKNQFDVLIDNNTKNRLMEMGLIGWFQFWTRFFDKLIVLLPVYVFFVYNYYWVDKTGEAASVSFFLDNIEAFAQSFIGLLVVMNNYELDLVYFERCLAYQDLESEKGYKAIERKESLEQLYKEPSTLEKSKRGLVKLQKRRDKRLNVFKNGVIEIKDISAHYSFGTRDVISALDLKIESNVRIGILGRGASGKTSLLRIIERSLEPYEGVVNVDNEELAQIDLADYRDGITVVERTPRLFQGSLGSNVSPVSLSFEKTAKIRREMINLGFSHSKLLNRDLEFKVQEGGRNLSKSERKIIAFMRAVERKSKIMVFDEPFEFLDLDQKNRILDKIEKVFSKSTVIVLSSDVRNVMFCDKVVVMSEGRIVQEGKPEELIKKRNGLFFNMWNDSNIEDLTSSLGSQKGSVKGSIKGSMRGSLKGSFKGSQK